MGKPLTFVMVVDAVIAQDYSDNPKTALEFRSNAKRWCTTVGSSPQMPAEDTLGAAFEIKVSEYTKHLNLAQPGNPRASRNVRAAATKLHAAYVAILALQELPLDFSSAFRQAMDAKGYVPAVMNRLLREQFYGREQANLYGAQLWAFTTALPDRALVGRATASNCSVGANCFSI